MRPHEPTTDAAASHLPQARRVEPARDMTVTPAHLAAWSLALACVARAW
jgi:hypothetical protein